MNENSIPPLDEDEAHLVERLRALAGSTQPRPDFAARLEADLLAQWNLTPAQRAPRRIIHLTHLWRQPMFKRLSLALTGVAAVALAIIFALSLFFGDGRGSLAPLPLMAAQSDLASTPLGAYGDVELALATDLPDGPSETPIYRQAISDAPVTPEEALTWAKRFNLPNPTVYRIITASNPEAMTVIADDGQTLSFGDENRGIYYNRGVDPVADRQPGDSDTPTALSFDAARDAAIDFLQSLDLLPDAYQVEERSQTSWPGVASPPIRSLIIRPLLDGYRVEEIDTRIYVNVGPDGIVQYLSLMSLTPPAFTQGETYPLRSAQTAFESLRTGDTKGGAFRVSVDSSASPEAEAEAAHTTYYRPDPATYQAGDPLTVHGNVTLMRAEATGEVRASILENYSVITFELTGSVIEEMVAELEFGYSEVIVQGIMQADTDARHRQLAVSEWSIAPPQVDRNPFERNRFVGTVEMEGDITTLVADDGARYRLLYPPDGLSDGDQVAVLAEDPAEGGDLPGLRWLAIESPPTTQEYVRSSGGSGGSARAAALKEIGEIGEAQVEKEMIEEAMEPVPTTRVIVGALRFENGAPVLKERYEDQQYRVVGLPDELNTGDDGLVVSVLGQVTPSAEAGDLPTLVWKADGPVSPYRIGDEIELEGMVSADIHVNGDERWIKAYFLVGRGPSYDPDYRLGGPTDLMEELAQHDRLHLRLQARVISDEDYSFGQLEVISFEKIWPEEKVQGFLGTHSVETLEGREVCTFTDNETGQRYVLFNSLSEHFTPDICQDLSNEEMKGIKQFFVTGVVRSDQTFAGLPVLDESGGQAGGNVNLATSADQLPLEHPQVIDESRRFKTRRILEEGQAIIDRVELVYYDPTGASAESHFTGVTPEFFLLQPVWVFHGHTEDGRATFQAYVQAVAEEYLQ